MKNSAKAPGRQPTRWKYSLNGVVSVSRNVRGWGPTCSGSVTLSDSRMPTPMNAAVIQNTQIQGRMSAKIRDSDPGTRLAMR